MAPIRKHITSCTGTLLAHFILLQLKQVLTFAKRSLEFNVLTHMAIDGASGIPDFSGSPSVWYDENGRPVLYRSLCTSSSPLSDFRNILVHSGSLNALQTLI